LSVITQKRVGEADKIRKQAEADKVHWVKKHQQIAAKVNECEERIEVFRGEYEVCGFDCRVMQL
jgi:hypothetical protein